MSYRARAVVVAWVCAAAWSTGGCAAGAGVVAVDQDASDSGPPGKLTLAPPLFVAGEEMLFDLSLRGVVVGTAAISAGEPGTVEGRRVIVVKSRLASTGVAQLLKRVQDDITSWIDLATSTPIRNDAVIAYGDRVVTVHNAFERRGVVVAYARGEAQRQRVQRLPSDAVALDLHAALGALRAWEPRLGERVAFYVMSGPRLWRNELRFVARESVRTAMGVYPAMRHRGVAWRLTVGLARDAKKQPRPYELWVSEDLNRLPLRVTARTEYGDVAAELVRYHRPGRFVRAR